VKFWFISSSCHKCHAWKKGNKPTPTLSTATPLTPGTVITNRTTTNPEYTCITEVKELKEVVSMLLEAYQENYNGIKVMGTEVTSFASSVQEYKNSISNSTS